MPNSYERSYQHDLDNVIDASDAVLAIGTEKVDTTTLKDLSLNNNDATIHGAMPNSGYFLGRTFDGDNDYLDCGNDNSLNITDELTYVLILKAPINGGREIIRKGNQYAFRIVLRKAWWWGGSGVVSISSTTNIDDNTKHVCICSSSEITGLQNVMVDGVIETEISDTGGLQSSSDNVYIGISSDVVSDPYNGIIYFFMLINDELSQDEKQNIFNTLARLPLYSHNFERYPNSDTSLTSVFPYTSGIITSGSFNKTDGLKCTSASTIVFSNSFEFDGSEYITLIINGVEYSGTTTVTQGTITATIAQGSNDITIDMGTNDVLEDIRIQFREEV